MAKLIHAVTGTINELFAYRITKSLTSLLWSRSLASLLQSTVLSLDQNHLDTTLLTASPCASDPQLLKVSQSRHNRHPA